MQNLTSAQLAQLEAELSVAEVVFREVLATRYLAACGFVIVLYDALETFSLEVRFVWRSRRSLSKYLFLIQRYLVILGYLAGLQAVAGFTPHMSTGLCKFLLASNSVAAAISIGLTDAMVALEVWHLWEKDKRFLRIIIATFAFTYLLTIAFMSVSVRKALPDVEFNQDFHVCALTEPIRFVAGVWGSGLLFEVIVFLSTLWNVYDKPRPAQSSVRQLLLRDGVLYFVCIMFLRSVNVVMSQVTQAPTFFLLGFFIWALVSVLINHLMLGQFITAKFSVPQASPMPLTVTTLTEVFEMDSYLDLQHS